MIGLDGPCLGDMEQRGGTTKENVATGLRPTAAFVPAATS